MNLPRQSTALLLITKREQTKQSRYPNTMKYHRHMPCLTLAEKSKATTKPRFSRLRNTRFSEETERVYSGTQNIHMLTYLLTFPADSDEHRSSAADAENSRDQVLAACLAAESVFKSCVLTHCCLDGAAPKFLADLTQAVAVVEMRPISIN